MNKWPMVQLGELLESVSRPEPVSPDRTYRILGARWYAYGLYLKDTLNGTQIQAPKVFRVDKGDFVYNRLFAWKGSFAVATDDNHGCYVSNEFPCFKIKHDKIVAQYLRYYFSRELVWTEVLAQSSGGTPTSRNRLKESAFLKLTLPVPPLPEQQRLVERIDALAAKIDEANRLRAEASTDTLRLLMCMAQRTDMNNDEKLRAGWKLTDIGNVIRLNLVSEKVDTTKSYPNLGIYSFARGLFCKNPINGLETSASSLHKVRAGQFIYSRLFAFEGAYGMVDEEFDGFFVSNEYPTFDCNVEQILPEFLEAYFRSSQVWKAVASGSKGLGDRRQRVQPDKILSHRIWLPPLNWQIRIKEMRTKLRKADPDLHTLSTQLDAMLPSILNRAFKGDL